MHMRPLWPGSEPRSISDWRPLADDLARFLDQQNLRHVIGWGHSMGATTTLRLALQRPEYFRAIVLIDPVFFPPPMILFWDLIYRLGLGYRVHPLVKGALKRREQFDSSASMYTNYRQKAVFKQTSDSVLKDYVDALGCPRPDGSVELCYTARWEARIYVTGVRADLELWRELPKLKIPLLIFRGAETNTFREQTGRLVQRSLSSVQVRTVPNATHLVALEKPEEILTIANEFMHA
jgi:pimeloyl-ACP methyl ester carboxylesterase